jgi:hypothetical protein
LASPRSGLAGLQVGVASRSAVMTPPASGSSPAKPSSAGKGGATQRVRVSFKPAAKK